MHKNYLGLMLSLLLVVLPSCGGRSAPGARHGDSGGWAADGQARDMRPASDGLPADGGVPDRKIALDQVPLGKVTVTTDRDSYGTSQAVKGTVHNGTSASIFLPGCAIFSRLRLEEGKWVDRGPAMMCGWEGNAVEVKPGASYSQDSYLELPGSWRLLAQYGTGCTPGVPLSGAKCAAMSQALSPVVQSAADATTCNSLNQQYKKQLAPAKACSTSVNTPQCTKAVTSDLSCGCPLYVNDTVQLEKLSNKWIDLQCFKVMPPCGIKCAAPAPCKCVGGTCQPG